MQTHTLRNLVIVAALAAAGFAVWNRVSKVGITPIPIP